MDNDLSHYISVEDGVSLYKVQAAMRERFGLISEANNLDKVTPEYGFLNDGKRGSNEKQAKLFEYNKVFRETINSANWHKIKNKIYIVNLPKELGGTKKMTGLEISQKIFEQVTKHNKRFYDILVGKEEVYRKYTDIVEKETDPKKIIQSLDKLAEVFAKDVQDAINTETPLNPNIGMDPLRRITKYLQLRQLKDSFQGKNILDPETGELFGTDAFVREIQNVPKQIEKTGEIPFDFYFPHMMFERKAVGESLRRQIKAIIKDLDSNNPAIVKAKRKELTNIMIRHKQLTGDWFTDTELTNRYTDINKILSGIGEKRKDLLDEGFKNFLKNRRVGNQFKRESHLGGFSYDPLAYNNYVKNILNTFYRQIGEISSNDAIYTFRKQKSSQIGQELTNRWTEYLQLYSNEASGAPVNIPNHVLNDPGMKIKGTLYAQFADNLWVKRMNKLRDKLGLRKDGDIPAELKDWDFGSLKAFSSFDARYNLMSLLAHPKSAVTNLFGGTVHTLASTGLENFRNARDINYLRSKVNKEWTSMGDVYNWVKSHGVVEDFLLYELQINPNVQGRKMQTALKEAFQKIKKNPDFKDKDLLDIAKRNGISATVFNKAAWFMRAPERILRRDAFVAHYLQAKRKFDGLIQDYNTPYLIDMAKKGVKGTQFLYSAPFRPAFARSSMGKIFSRFQLWGYNSVRFRNDALREAKIYGFEGEAMKRAERIFMADMMMFGLAGMFPLSIFETALPAPWNYMQDMSDLMFGDEKERDRAFYGTYPRALAPLQVVTPPSLRLLPPLFKAIVEDDYGRLSDYHMWAAAPYGRLARSVVGPGGILNNPTRMVETMTGFPLLSLSKITRDAKKIDLPSPGDDAKYVY